MTTRFSEAERVEFEICTAVCYVLCRTPTAEGDLSNLEALESRLRTLVASQLITPHAAKLISDVSVGIALFRHGKNKAESLASNDRAFLGLLLGKLKRMRSDQDGYRDRAMRSFYSKVDLASDIRTVLSLKPEFSTLEVAKALDYVDSNVTGRLMDAGYDSARSRLKYFVAWGLLKKAAPSMRGRFTLYNVTPAGHQIYNHLMVEYA